MKKNNKGFSLVELIVVVAIMAVLMTVLAPMLLKYVEQSRLQKDNSAIAEIANAIEIAMANETINNSVDATGVVIEITDGDTANKKAKTVTFSSTDTNALIKELSTVIGTYTTTSNTYRDLEADIEITVTNTNGVVKVSVTGWINKVGGEASTTSNPKVL